MAEIKAFAPPDVSSDDHIIRRLGWAVVRQWSHLPSDAKEIIREQAVFTEIGAPTTQLNEQIKAFIRKHGDGL
jgi:hypothetical protein